MFQLEYNGTLTQGQFKKQIGMNINNRLLCRGKRITVPHTMRMEIIALVHNHAHLGTENTISLIRRNFYWKRMNVDIEEYCRGCLTSQRNKLKLQPKERLVPIEVATKPREVIAYDVTTLPWASTKHRYFLLLIDLFSKYIELAPMREFRDNLGCNPKWMDLSTRPFPGNTKQPEP